MEEGQSFVVKDRRSGSSEGKEEKTSAENPTPEKQAAESVKSSESARVIEAGQAEQNIPVNFSSFILSLGTSALIHLGEEADPATGQKTVQASSAKQVIDLITLLQAKTAGNLSKEEEHFISELLFTLRMKFIALEKTRHS